MGGVADDHRDAPAQLRVPDQLVDALHVRASGVQNLAALRRQCIVGALRLTVGADEHRRAVGHVLRFGHRPGSQFFQMGDDVAVVGDVAQHVDRAFPGALLRCLHRTADAIAESGGLCQLDDHACSPSARMRIIRSSAIR